MLPIKFRFFLAALSIALFLTGCLPSNRVPMKSYHYILEYDSPKVQITPKQASILVETFSAAPAFNTDHMLYGPSPYQLSEYAYHLWRANPGEIVASFILRDIRQSGLFAAAVNQMDVSTPINYRLAGSIDEFLEHDEASQWFAVAALTVSLLRENTQEPSEMLIFQKSYRVSKPCRAKNPEALAAAMSLAVAEISAQLIMDISDAI